MIRFKFKPAIFASLAALILITSGLGGCMDDHTELHGAGASFPAPIYARWQALFHREHPHISVHYQAVGSGKGIKTITARKADFGASDALLKKSEKRALPAPLLTIPTVLGPVVIAYNLPRVKGELTLSGELIADIYLGKITSWDHPRLKALNPQLNLPSLPIRVAHRTDSSGTSHIFTDYLSSVSDEWKEDVGKGKRVFWPTGDDWAGEGNDGVAHRILLERGGIGYLELKYAQNAGLKYAVLVNRAGQKVRPTPASVQEAEQNTPAQADSYLKPSIVNAPGEKSYPIAGFTYLLVYRDLSAMKPEKAHALVKYLKWIMTKGQVEADKLHYTPLPGWLRDKMLTEIERLKLPSLPQDEGHLGGDK
jgi:phosphate transport system substrate-binding protein